MTDVRFPFLKLPNDLGLKVMKTMSFYEQTAVSFASKKSYSKIKSLRIPISRVQIKLMGWTVITLTTKDESEITFKLTSHNNGLMTSLDVIPVNLDVLKGTSPFSIRNRAFTVSNQGMNVGEWIPHLCSIFQCENYEADFTIGMPQLDIQLLRSSLPKLRGINLVCDRDGRNEQGIFYAQRILRAFLPDVAIVRLSSVPLHENLSLQHIGTTNLKILRLCGCRNLKIDDLLSLNVENCCINDQITGQITLRDLNRFFQLWRKGSNPQLKQFFVIVKTENNSDRNILLKGLQAEETVETEEGEKSFMIRNSVGVSARIIICDDGIRAIVQFAVSGSNKEILIF